MTDYNPYSMGPDSVRIFIGYDQVEAVAYYTFCHSIWKRASQPVSITPIIKSQLERCQLHKRDWDPKQSNEFSFTRWLVPALCQYQGWALFFDCDMLMRDDIAKLWYERDYRYAVQVVKHIHDASEEPDTKYLGRPQSAYQRKNWSSVMLFNCAQCKQLTPSYINTAHGLDLHQFQWLEDDQIGDLPPAWNHLVNVHKHRDDASNVHFTLGGPYFQGYEDCPYADEWREEYIDMIHCEQLAMVKEHEKTAAV